LKEIKSSAGKLSEILSRARERARERASEWVSEQRRVGVRVCVCLWRPLPLRTPQPALSAAEGCRRFVNVRFVQSSTAFVTGNVASFVRRRKKSRISEDFCWILHGPAEKAVPAFFCCWFCFFFCCLLFFFFSRGAGVCACVPPYSLPKPRVWACACACVCVCVCRRITSKPPPPHPHNYQKSNSNYINGNQWKNLACQEEETVKIIQKPSTQQQQPRRRTKTNEKRKAKEERETVYYFFQVYFCSLTKICARVWVSSVNNNNNSKSKSYSGHNNNDSKHVQNKP